MEIKKALMVSQEIDPYIGASEMAQFGRNLAQGMQEMGAEVRSFMPKYGSINERRNQLHEVIRLSGLNISINDADHPLIIKVATLQPTRLQVYFIDNDDYFYRHKQDKLETVDWVEENDERSIFFVRGTCETVKKLRWEADLIVCLGWITALMPLYVKNTYNEDPSFRSAKMVYSIYDSPLPENFNENFVNKLLMDGFDIKQLKALCETGTAANIKMLHKLAIDHADAIVESQPDTDPEIVEYAINSGKPFLRYSEGMTAEQYNNFYQSL